MAYTNKRLPVIKRITTSTSGTPVRVNAIPSNDPRNQIKVCRVEIRPDPANSGTISVGTGSAAPGDMAKLGATSFPVELQSPDGVYMDLCDIWVDGSTNAQVVQVIYWECNN